MRSKLVAAAIAAAVLTTACDPVADPITTTTTTTTTTFAPITVAPVSTTVAPGVDPAVHQQLVGTVTELALEVQQLRGLTFVQQPRVLILSGAEFESKYEDLVASEVAGGALEAAEATYRLLGQYSEPRSIAGAIRELYDAGGAIAFYDSTGRDVVIDGSRAELSPMAASIVVRALAWALIDQYHDAHSRLHDLSDAGAQDQFDALTALAEGDAIAVQLRYLQGLPEDDREAAALEALEAQPRALGRVPTIVRRQISFPSEAGLALVDRIVAGGGYAALDRAYEGPAISTEQVLHPERYAINEVAREVPELAVALDGYETTETGSYGEWRLTLLLESVISPGLLTQTAAGWGGDAYQLLVDGDDMVFVYIYGGDSEADTIEVVQALLEVARSLVGAEDGIDSGGGVLFEGEGRYVFVDRIGDGLKFVVATDPQAGAAARNQIRIP